MPRADLQAQCELGQRQLMEMRYLEAEATLAKAELAAWAVQDWDSLSRLYLPLQEARRQRRQRCGEGIVCLDLIAESPNDAVDGRRVLENFPHGQLLVAGWGTAAPATRVRTLQAENDLYVETFLAAVYPVAGGDRAVAIVATDKDLLPSAELRTFDELTPLLPSGSILMHVEDLPRGSRRGGAHTYGQTLALWERLHLPFLAAADAESDPILKMEGYRHTIRVDYACELAHQKLAAVARQMPRTFGASDSAARR
jgi:hypothetical protein